MAKKENNILKEFVKTKEYEDICYFIDHVENQDVTNSCLEVLGYSIGIVILDTKTKIKRKDLILGAQGEIRVITCIQPFNSLIAECIIISTRKTTK